MTEQPFRPDPQVVTQLLDNFRAVRQLRNHWARHSPPIGNYWFATFDESPDLHYLVQDCQRQFQMPYYDHLPVSDLHLTIDRIAAADSAGRDQLDAVAHAANRACQQLKPFTIHAAILNGTPGAIGLNVFPSEPIHHLRKLLRDATLSVLPDAPIMTSTLKPHITIAYANTTGVPAADAIAVAERLAALPAAQARISTVALVRLERLANSYKWQVLAHVPLG